MQILAKEHIGISHRHKKQNGEGWRGGAVQGLGGSGHRWGSRISETEDSQRSSTNSWSSDVEHWPKLFGISLWSQRVDQFTQDAEAESLK